MTNITLDDVANMNDIVVGEYFRKQRFKVEKLDEQQDPCAPSACDWLAQSTDTSFLCEVKTITSVQRGENTQGEFRKLENQIQDYFNRKKAVQNLPYHMHFHSHTLSIPDDSKLYKFLRGVSKNLQQIHANGSKIIFPISAQLNKYTSLHITPSWSGKPEVKISAYSGLNCKAIEGAVRTATGRQLRNSGKEFPGIARLIVLNFASQIFISSQSEVIIFDDLPPEGKYLWDCIGNLLRQYSSLSAVAVMSDQADPHFIVYHNPNVSSVAPLDKRVFDDGTSVQFDSRKDIPKVPIRKLENLDEFIDMIVSNAENQKRQPLTKTDYEKLKKRHP